MFLTTGPWFGAQPYNPALFGGRVVGMMTWTATAVETGTLSYTVDGVAVTKNVVRQTLVNDDFSGHYGGGLHQDFTNCVNPANNGTTEDAGLLDITQSGNAITLNVTATLGGGVCTYSGTLGQDGQMGSITGGTYHCNNGASGTFAAFEMQVNITGFTGRFTNNLAGLACSGSGWFGGVRSTTF